MAEVEDDETKLPLNGVKPGKVIAERHTGVDTGWSWMVLLASFGVFVCIGGTMLAVGIIHTTLLERYHESVALTAWAGSLHSALVSVGGPLSSALIDRFSCRVALVSSGICYVVGYLATAFAPNIWVAIFTCGIISGCGGAFGYTAAMVVVGFNFDRRRNIAVGISVSGVGVGLFAFATLMELAREHYGSVGFFIILAALSANIITFGCMCFPSSIELKTQQERRDDKVSGGACASLQNYGSVVTNKSVICLCLSMLFYCFGTYLMFVHMQMYIVSKGFTATHASYFISLPGIITVFGRILTGFIANWKRVHGIVWYSGSMVLVFAIIVSFPLYSEYTAGQIFYGIGFGLFFGSCYAVLPSVTIECVGINFMSASIGLMFFFAGVGSLIGPLFAGLIVDSGGSYDHAVVMAGITTLVGAVFGALSVCFKKEDPLEKSVEVNVIVKSSDVTEVLLAS